MNNAIDIAELDKSNFRCFRFEDDSLYYGEVAYLDELNNVINDLENYTAEMLNGYKMVRHGAGVQMFGVEDTQCLSRYEGEWKKDKKNGNGICYFSDKSTYEGQMFNDKFQGYGKFIWPNNDIYIGAWVEGRMEGEGEFKHHDGHILKGVFRNNYFFDKERSVNPFLSSDELAVFRAKSSEYYERIRHKNEKFSRSNILRVTSQQELLNSIENTIKSNKTPLILRSTDNLIKKEDIFELITDKHKELDLRHEFVKLRQSSISTSQVFDDVKKNITYAMVKGIYLFLNFDESRTKYEELYDPDIKIFYGRQMLSPFIWKPNLMAEPKCWQSHLKENGNVYEFKFNKNFKFSVYSKYVIQPDLQEHDLINLIEKRFEKCFPLNQINVIILDKFNK